MTDREPSALDVHALKAKLQPTSKHRPEDPRAVPALDASRGEFGRNARSFRSMGRSATSFNTIPGAIDAGRREKQQEKERPSRVGRRRAQAPGDEEPHRAMSDMAVNTAGKRMS